MNTIEWAAVMCWSANAVSSGKPMTPPKAVMISGPISWRSGLRWRKTESTIPARMAAIEARATVRNTGSKSATAARVAGSDPEKISMPRNPLIQPIAALSMPPCGSASLALPETEEYNFHKLYWYRDQYRWIILLPLPRPVSNMSWNRSASGSPAAC